MFEAGNNEIRKPVGWPPPDFFVDTGSSSLALCLFRGDVPDALVIQAQ